MDRQSKPELDEVKKKDRFLLISSIFGSADLRFHHSPFPTFHHYTKQLNISAIKHIIIFFTSN